ncbi:MAG: hypothetical protein A2Y40_01900 [Candidatus Margulisbacteria bacterium GWF2_35_9]|nr:MAG: hypothetical protein A2Y40_01900 [Candidatus Margulisbacteria bacterium GWF2_35_9]
MRKILRNIILSGIFGILITSCISFGEVSDENWDEIKKYYYLSKTISQDPWIHFNLAMVYAYTGFVEEGFNSLSIIPELDPEFSEKVIKKYKAKIYRDPTNWKNHFYYAFALYFDKQKDGAIAELKKVVELTEDNSIRGWAYGYIAVIYGEKNQWDEAMESIDYAIHYEPNGAALYFAMGLAKKELGDNFGAATAILKASALQAKQVLSKKSIRNLKNEK